MADSLDSISDEVTRCTRCRLHECANRAVPGEGPANARVFIIGQAPGAVEDRLGRPFLGRAGIFLCQSLDEVGLRREDVFMTSVVKHFPPQNRQVRADEIEACLPFLLRQLEVVDPEIVILMGRAAESIRSHPILDSKKVLITVHPSAAMRFPKMRAKFKRELGRLKELL